MRNRVYNISPVLHLAFWTLVASAIYSVASRLFGQWEGLLFTSLSVLLFITVGYFHALVITPRFFNKKKIGYFLVSTILSILFTTTIHSLIFSQFKDPFQVQWQGGSIRRPLFVPSIFGSIFLLFISTVYALTRQFFEHEKRTAQLEKEKIAHELNFLRSQINPHFLFNALNNLHATVQLKPEKAGDYILKLGDMLRYVLEDCKKEKVSLADEIKYLENYIFFQRQKDEKFTKIVFNIRGGAPTAYQLEPMLFIPLLENSFQHGYLEKAENRWIEIDLSANDAQIKLTVKNNLGEDGYTEKEGFGVGLKNIKRRLELLYPEKHRLISERRNDHYIAELILEL